MTPRFRNAFTRALAAALSIPTLVLTPACRPGNGWISRVGPPGSVTTLASSSRFTEANLRPVVRLWAWQGDDGDPYKSGFATAVFIRSDGVLITNAHVVTGARRVHIFLENGASFPVKVLGADPLTDLALIKVAAPSQFAKTTQKTPPLPRFPVIRWGDSGRMLPGDPVYAVGHPFGLHRSVSLGIVSAIPEPPPELAGLSAWIQTDASINPGNSGGPLLNSNGEMIGLSSAILTRSGGSHGVGFAIPSQDVRRIAEDLLAHGEITRGWMGVSGQQMTPDLSRHFLPAELQRSPLDPTIGVLIADIHPLSPAAHQLEVGDVLTQLDGNIITGPAWLRTRIQATAPGAPLRFHGFRKHHPFDATVLAARFPEPPNGPIPLPGPRAGRLPPAKPEEKAPLTPADGLKLESRAAGAVTILEIKPGSPAFLAGLLPGDKILRINDEKPASAADALARLKSTAGAPMVVWIERPKRGRIYVTLKAK